MAMETLLTLQKLADKSYKGTKTAVSKTEAGESFADIWNEVKREQEEWDKTLNEYDLTKYKLGLMDSFWADGRRTVSQIARLVGLEGRYYSEGYVSGYLDILCRCGLITFDP
jgi:hypothetical protein